MMQLLISHVMISSSPSAADSNVRFLNFAIPSPIAKDSTKAVMICIRAGIGTLKNGVIAFTSSDAISVCEDESIMLWKVASPIKYEVNPAMRVDV